MKPGMTFPSHLIDPAKKDRKWILQFVRAAWSSWNGFGLDRSRFQKIDDYAQGAQSIDQYKPVMGVDEADQSWTELDFAILPVIPGLLVQALGRINKAGYNIVATAIDPLAQSEMEDHFKKEEAKIKIRTELDKIMPGLSDYTPAAKTSINQPEDMDELELQRNWTYRHQYTIEIEQALQVVFNHNKFDQTRKDAKEDSLVYGLGGFKEFVDSNGAIKIRKVNPAGFLSGPCRNRDFSDAEWMGEILEMTIADLKQLAQGQFTAEEYENIAASYCGRMGNPEFLPEIQGTFSYENFKIQVLDFEFFSINEDYYLRSTDPYSNVRISRAPYGSRSKSEDKEYLRTSYKVVYKCMYIIGTDHLFNYGLCTDMKRSRSSLTDTTMSFHMYAPGMRNMRIISRVNQIIPLADQIQIAWLKLQQAIAEARPKGVQIELGGLEDISYGSGGKKLAPHEVMELFFQKGVLIYRKQDLNGQQTNYRPIEELQNGIGDEAVKWYNVIMSHLNFASSRMGLNDYTDGSSPDPRTLSLVAQMANEGTNNSLYPFIEADAILLKSLSRALILRMASVNKRKPIEGYVKALGQGTVDFFRLSEDVSTYEFGIELENKPTDEERQKAFEIAQTLAGQGLLEFEDYFVITHHDNLKVAQQIIAYKVRKRKEQQQQEALQMQQANAQAQIQSAAAAEEEKRKTLQMEFELKYRLEQLKSETQLKVAELRADSVVAGAQFGAESRVASTVLQQGQNGAPNPAEEEDVI